MPLFWAFLTMQYDLSIIKEGRIRLILLWRFLRLFRSFDLSMTLRQVSSVGTRDFISVKGKNKSSRRWKEVLALQDKQWCPCEAMLHYVHLTSSLVPSGSPVWITLHRSYTLWSPTPLVA